MPMLVKLLNLKDNSAPVLAEHPPPLPDHAGSIPVLTPTNPPVNPPMVIWKY